MIFLGFGALDMQSEHRNLLVAGAKTFGVHLNEENVAAFDLYLRELLKWNEKINLTAIRTENGIIVKHFLDSLSVYPHVVESSSLLDIGSGPGFPGIPLKIVTPDLEITLIDSVRKKVDFQRHIIRTLGLKGIEAVHGCVQETGAVQKKMQGRYDRVISRAFADLETFLRLGLPFLKKGGLALVMKGRAAEKEIEMIVEMIGDGEKFPCRLREAVTLTLPLTSFRRTILLFEK